MNIKKALVFGANGQDGSYLSELLVELGYQVYGVVRRSSVNSLWRLQKVLDSNDFHYIEGDITDYFSVSNIIRDVFDRDGGLCFNLSAQSHVHTSFSQPDWTAKTIYNGTLNILEAIRTINPNVKLYQASSSEMWGTNQGVLYFSSPLGDFYDAPKYMQDEKTTFEPQSPYAIAKVAAHHLCDMYRNAYGLFVSQGILTNHESSRRGDRFVTKKIVNYLAYLHHGNFINNPPKKLKLGNLDAKRDWGHSADFVRGMFLMLNRNKSGTYVLSTGETYSVRDFVRNAFLRIDIENWFDYVEIDESLMRPSEVPYLCGSFAKAYKELGWQPKIGFEGLVTEMVDFAVNNKNVYV